MTQNQAHSSGNINLGSCVYPMHSNARILLLHGMDIVSSNANIEFVVVNIAGTRASVNARTHVRKDAIGDTLQSYDLGYEVADGYNTILTGLAC